MTKNKEITILEKLLSDLPAQDTYSGAWLREQIEQIKGDIQSDHFPQCLSYRATTAQAEEIVADARAAAAEVFKQATVDIESLNDMAQRKRESTDRLWRASLRRTIEDFLKEI